MAKSRIWDPGRHPRIPNSPFSRLNLTTGVVAHNGGELPKRHPEPEIEKQECTNNIIDMSPERADF